MPKKSPAARSGAQRQKPKTQKSFELVRPAVTGRAFEDENEVIAPVTGISTATIPAAERPSSAERLQEEQGSNEVFSSVPKGSAAARIAARRISSQRTQRSSASLITAEHFAYVRRDLIIIASLAVIMITAIIVAYFMLGQGA